MKISATFFVSKHTTWDYGETFLVLTSARIIRHVPTGFENISADVFYFLRIQKG